MIFRSLTKIVVCLSLAVLAACAENPAQDPQIKDPVVRTFPENFEKVWRAIQLAMRKYPVRVNTMESGILETDYVKGEKLFADPNSVQTKDGLRYKIVIRAVKGRIDNHPSVKVTILKTSEIQPDFFSGYQPLSSNGLEEETIMYRIGRFLDIDRVLSRVH